MSKWVGWICKASPAVDFEALHLRREAVVLGYRWSPSIRQGDRSQRGERGKGFRGNERDVKISPLAQGNRNRESGKEKVSEGSQVVGRRETGSWKAKKRSWQLKLIDELWRLELTKMKREVNRGREGDGKTVKRIREIGTPGQRGRDSRKVSERTRVCVWVP
ncbi:hypothetical protein ACLOJK_003754 [Asimina triloba]